MRISRARRAAGAALFAILATVVPSAGSSLPAAPVSGSFVPHQVIVGYAPHASAAVRLAARRSVSAKVLDREPALAAELLAVPGDVRAALPVLRKVAGVRFAEPNVTGYVTAAPPPSRANDPLVKGIGPHFVDRQWYLQRINAPYAWAQWPRTYYSARSKPRSGNVKVAVLDTTIDVEHHDWRNAGGGSPSSLAGGQIDLRNATSFVRKTDVSGGKMWHGTFVAGIIGAATDNSRDMAGIAYGSEIMPVAVANGAGATNAFAVARGITWATDRGAKIINVSLVVHGGSNEVTALRNAVNRAVSKGSLIVSALGHNTTTSDDSEYPAGFAAENPGVLAVGASDIFDRRHIHCSKKARHMSLVAPGELIWSLDPQDHHERRDETIRREPCGTSYSAAIVSGVAALVADKFKGIAPAALARRLLLTADDIAPAGRDDETGAGRVNAERALWTNPGPSVVWRTLPTAGPGGKVTLYADAQSSAGVAEAELLVNGTQRNRGPRTRARGRNREIVSFTIDTKNYGEGPHELHIRAKDRNGKWGPAGSTVLIVDRTPPKVPPPVTNPPTTRPMVDPDNHGSAILFTVNDNWSHSLRVKITILDAAFESQAELVYKALPANQTYSLPWSEIEKKHGGPLLPGAYRVIVTARDLAGLDASPFGDTAIVVLGTVRLVPGVSPSGGATTGPLGVNTALPTAVPKPTATPTAPATPSPSASPSTPAVATPTATPTITPPAR